MLGKIRTFNKDDSFLIVLNHAGHEIFFNNQLVGDYQLIPAYGE